MKTVDQLTLRLRNWRRTTSARVRSGSGLPGVVKSILPGGMTPARLVLDLQSGWANGAVDRRLTPADWKEVITDVVEWLGPVPVTVILKDSAEDWCMRVVRYAHRLECPVTLETRGAGFDAVQCKQFLLAGVARVRVELDGRSLTPEREAVSQSVVRFLETRKALATKADISVRVRCDEGSISQMPALVGWALQIGIDGIEFVGPDESESLDVAINGSVADRIARVEGVARNTLHPIQRMLSCGCRKQPDVISTLRRRPAVGHGLFDRGLRLTVSADGSFGTCAYEPPTGRWQKGTRLGALWRDAVKDVEIAPCDRVCQHPDYAELMPTG